MSACTHGQPLWHHLAVGDICPVCRTTIVAVAVAAATGHRGEVAPEATPQASLEVPLPATIAAGVASCRKDEDGPPPVPTETALAAAIADPAPTSATSCPALRLPVATPSAMSAHGAGSAPSLFDTHEETDAHAATIEAAVRGVQDARRGSAHGCTESTGDSDGARRQGAVLAHRGNPGAHRGSPDRVPATPALARPSDPDTAHEAAAAVTDVQRRNVYRAVLEALVEHGPSTDHDLARYVAGKLGHPIGQTSVGVRRGELRNAGLVADSGHKGRTPTGAKAIRWALTPAGIDAAGVAA